MPEHPPAAERDVTSTSFVRRVRIAAVIGVLVWVLTLVAVLSGWFDPRWDSRWKEPVQTALIFVSPLFLFLVMPAVVLSFSGGLRSAKTAVWLLILALIAFVAMLAEPLVKPLLR
jgi:hypothetical protein